MTSSPYASDARIAEACTALGADFIGQTEQTLLQQLVVAAATGGGSAPSATTWGGITGTLGDQTDLQAALNAKLNLTGGSLSAAVSVPTAANSPIANARANGVMFGASPATANEGIAGFNSRLNFYAQGEHIVQAGTLEFRFGGTTWLEWAPSSAAAGAQTFLSGAQAAATLQIGKASATPIDQTFKGPNGSGTNIVGGDVSIAAGQSTGNAAPAVLRLQGTTSVSSGSSVQALVDHMLIGAGLVEIENSVDLQLGNEAVAETPTATHTMIIKDSLGASYKVLCVPI